MPNPLLWQAETWKNLPVVHGVSSRAQGNMGLSAGEAFEVVWQRRQLLLSELEIPATTPIITAEQVHGTKVAVISDESLSQLADNEVIPQSDALVTNLSNVALMVIVADCTPIFMFDSEHKAIALVHGGWRGVVSGILENTVEILRTQFQTQPQHLQVTVGPHLQEHHFEVQADFVEAIMNSHPDKLKFIKSSEALTTFDLTHLISTKLLHLGVQESNLTLSSDCTLCDPQKWFSHRTQPSPKNRQAAVLMLR